MTILRVRPGRPSEIWCRCDGGPLGFMTTAAHGHDDALSVELRHGGVDVLADPGTYCYQLEPFWRSYFRSNRVTTPSNSPRPGTPSRRGHSSGPHPSDLVWRRCRRAR